MHQRIFARIGRGFFVVGTAIGVALATPPIGSCQTAPNTYYANDGTNGTRDVANGEAERDLLGNITLFNHSAATNPYTANWNPAAGPFPTFLAALRKHAANLTQLNNAINLQCSALPNSALVPFETGQVILDPTWTTNPKTQTPWWNSSVTFQQWAYRINGGMVVFSKRLDRNPNPTHLLMVNLPWHGSDYGTNYPPSSRVPPEADFYTVSSSDWTGTPTNRPLFVDEQALDQGHLVASVMENQSVGF